jgi:acyl CoA:acetate/3-ketoacid CoA transferase beta subunit
MSDDSETKSLDIDLVNLDIGNKSVDLKIYAASRAGKLNEVISLFAKGGHIDMAVMGSAEAKNSDICWWAIEHGGCILWTIDQTHKSSIIPHKYGKNLSMLKGPGDVPKGTFITK